MSDDAAPIGAAIDLDGIAHTPQITRQPNSHIAPDRALAGGRRAGRTGAGRPRHPRM